MARGDSDKAKADPADDPGTSEGREKAADQVEAAGGGNTEVIEPTAPGQNPVTLGQQMEVTPDRGGATHQHDAARRAVALDADGEHQERTPNDVRPAVVVGTDGKLRQVKQIKTR